MLGRSDAAEQRFVRESLLALGSERPGLREAARAVRNWDRVLAIAAAGSVAESIWSGVSLRGLEEEIPEPARSVFQEAHAGATARNALLLSEAAEVQAAFTAAGIESVILKGPGLLVAHYPDIGARHVADVDILVREGDVARAEEVARALGTTSMPVKLLAYGPEEPVWNHIHAPPLRTGRGVVLEIHDRVPGGASDGSDFSGALERSRTAQWQGRQLRIPSPADLAVVACVHVFVFHLGAETFLLRHLADLAVIFGSGATDWEEVAAKAPRDEGDLALRASRRLLVTESPAFLEAWRDVTALRIASWTRTFAREGGSIHAAVRMLFPTRSFMASRYDLHPQSRLIPVLYLWRPVRGLWALLTGR